MLLVLNLVFVNEFGVYYQGFEMLVIVIKGEMVVGYVGENEFFDLFGMYNQVFNFQLCLSRFSVSSEMMVKQVNMILRLNLGVILEMLKKLQ